MAYGTPLYRKQGAYTEGVTPGPAVFYGITYCPTGINAGDMLILAVSYKTTSAGMPQVIDISSNVVFTIPSNGTAWTNGLGDPTVDDQGGASATMAYKIADGTESGAEVDIEFDQWTAYTARVLVYTKPPDSEWITPACTYGSYVPIYPPDRPTSSWTTDGLGNTGTVLNEIDDLLIALTTTNEDAYGHSAEVISGHGLNFDLADELVDFTCGYGSHFSQIIAQSRVYYITSPDGYQWFTMTNTGHTDYAAVGVSVIMTLRVEPWHAILKRRTGGAAWVRARWKRRTGGLWVEVDNSVGGGSGKILKKRNGSGGWDPVSCLALTPSTHSINLDNTGTQVAITIDSGNEIDMIKSDSWIIPSNAYITSGTKIHGHSDAYIAANANSPGQPVRDGSTYLQIDGITYDSITIHQAAGDPVIGYWSDGSDTYYADDGFGGGTLCPASTESHIYCNGPWYFTDDPTGVVHTLPSWLDASATSGSGTTYVTWSIIEGYSSDQYTDLYLFDGDGNRLTTDGINFANPLRIYFWSTCP